MKDSLKIVTCIFCICMSPFSSRAELAVGSEGKFKDTTEIASSQLHQGALATVQVFLGSIDLHNIDLAESYKTKIVSQLKDAAAAYHSAAGYAGNRKLNPVPGTDQDKQDVEFFFEHMKEFGFNGDLSEEAVTLSVQNLLNALGNRISSTNVKSLSSDIREQQKFFKYILNV